MKNIFEASVTNEIIGRINQLSPESKAIWGKMSVAQMLAHCCVTYEMIYDETHPKAGFFKTLIMKLFVKNIVVGPKPYKKNSPTAPAFVIKDQRNFQTEKKRLIDYLNKTQELGGTYFDGKTSNSFGNLTESEWNIMFYKHLDHHLSQFAV
ncbi:DUF1569 domain-containing protein [uncultured Arcticibacterium sp.]|uniref:DUF1569 domain-containing protein n=1 Tax=uncultured Arcticibacterium sp. TaxID=2173042 RepID=UPI0030FA7EDB